MSRLLTTRRVLEEVARRITRTSRGRALATVLAGTAASLAIACGGSEVPAPAESAGVWQAPESRPNVLLVVVDALRRDHVGAYGHPLPITPHIDALVAESFLFTNAYSQSTWTKPSVATLFTSLYPAQHGLGRTAVRSSGGFQTDALSRRLVTLAERFRRSGYATLALSANVHVQRKTGFAQGFDRFVSMRTATAFELNDRFRRWLAESGGDRPFFAYFHTMDAHWPYRLSLPGMQEQFGPTAVRPSLPRSGSQVAAWAERFLDQRNLRALDALYSREVAYADRAFGELIEGLRETGRYDETLVVLTADHGEGFDEHGELLHGFRPFDEVAAVPLVLRLPKSFGLERATLDDPVGLIDLAPTLVDLLGLKPRRRIEGRSLLPLLMGERLDERAVYLEGGDARALRSRTHKLMSSDDGEVLCFDLASDPQELQPASDPLPAECRALASELAELERRFEESRPAADPEESVPLTPDEVEALRSLGYLEGG